ncbi:MAG: hypothetical protein ACR650_12760 [Methylocystis sp.]|jgi:hypothetical protein
MSLTRIDHEVHREDRGFSFYMRIVGTEQNVRVFVADDALCDEAGEGRRAQFGADEEAFEAIANSRHSSGRVSGDGFITVTLADLASID